MTSYTAELEQTEMHWKIDGAQAMLKLRCVAINDPWDELTEFRIQRPYPHISLYRIQTWPMKRTA